MRPEDHYHLDIVEAPWLPKGTVLLMPKQTAYLGAVGLGPIMWYRDPWPPTRMPQRPLLDRLLAPGSTEHTMGQYADDQRSRALEFLADLLDDWCRETTLHGEPLNPDDVWRGPKHHEQDQWTRQMRYRADETMALAVNRPDPAQFAKIVVT